MNRFVKWASQNKALSFFFATEVVWLVIGLAMIIRLNITDDAKKTGFSTPSLTIITEQAYKELVDLELEAFDYLSVLGSKVVVMSRAEAVQSFAKNEQAVLILSKPLDSVEMATMQLDPDRMPIRQDVIDHSGVVNVQLPVFIRDNTPSPVEERLAAFLSDDQVQDAVYQKFQR